MSADVGETIRAAAPRLERALKARDATLALDLHAERLDVEERLLAPLETLLLSLARYVPPRGVMRVAVLCRTGDDAEVLVTGVHVPPEFPRGSPEEDLWRLADDMLRGFHRARIAVAEDRAMMLLPAAARARGLRMRDGTRAG